MKICLIESTLTRRSVIICCVLRIIAARFIPVNISTTNFLELVASPTVLCVVGNRLLIDLKEVAERQANGVTDSKIQTVSAMRFKCMFFPLIYFEKIVS